MFFYPIQTNNKKGTKYNLFKIFGILIIVWNDLKN